MPKTRASAGSGQKRRRDAEYADLFDFAPVTYALLDSAGIVLNVNLAATRLLNVPRKDLIGRPLRAFVSAKDRGELLEHFRRCRLSYRVVESEIRFTNDARGPVICRVYTKRVSYEGRAAYPTVIVDQTERLELDEARLKAERDKQAAERSSELAQAGNAAKDRFLAAVSHELRTPLTPALLAASQLSSWEGIGEEARELASTVTRNIQFEAHLIDDLLDVARINRNRLVLDFDTIDVHEVVQEAVDVCRPAAEGKKQVLSLALVAEYHHARADRSRLRQVFWNLLNNAIKFTPVSGEVVIRSVNVPDQVLRVSVSDSGEGIDASILEHLFAPFERHSVEHETRGGLGLGLSISKGIMAAHGGQIWAASEGPGQGSTFAVELATVPAEHVEQAQVPEIKEERHDNAGAPRVLVIEDDQDSRELVVMFLAKFGYNAEAASTFDEAIERLDQPWDVVMTDLSLPGGSGLDIGRRARSLERPPKRLIAFTGYGSAADMSVTREAGFDDHLVKPLDLESLLKAIGGPRNGDHCQERMVRSPVRARPKHR
jgi:PAS domain S-box-containing protein